jgi:hypothetical protein
MTDLELKPLVVHEIVIGEQKEKKYLGKYTRKIKGGKIFEYNPATKMINELDTEQSKVFSEKGCFYVEALNFKNALIRLQKGKLICRT